MRIDSVTVEKSNLERARIFQGCAIDQAGMSEGMLLA